MPISELVDYIQEQTQEGASAQEVRVTLLEAGWREVDIENGFHDVAAGLHPTTPGASIHEDLAQVRGMVAHLATRLKDLESTIATFASVAATPMSPPGLPMQRQLAYRPAWHTAQRVLWVVFAILLPVVLMQYGVGLVQRDALVLQDFYVMIGAAGLLCMVVAIIFLRQGRPWPTILACGEAIALWSGGVIVAWQTYQTLEWTVALALEGLFCVVAVVVRRWSLRYAR